MGEREHLNGAITQILREIKRCYQCGTCVSSCPVAKHEGRYNPRRILRRAQLENLEPLIGSDVIWLCTTCYTCVDRCPQSVGAANLILELRRMSVRGRKLPEGFIKIIEELKKDGYIYPIDSINRRRERMGLPPIVVGKKEEFEKILEGII
ncbi:CoB--CoM heterodisulfide reductase subunit C [Candidatus Bathyarchaeota archaeon ex4484_205]|nr:MAG: CoB--CoM heterodisulfide reductase subunit C [Candidatus Bathyarchaeota archaeon ex4484_205]